MKGKIVSMLRQGDMIEHVGRGVGGDFMEIEHLPTGIKRRHPPPLGGPDAQKDIRRRFFREIEAELIAAGLPQYIEDDK